MNQTNKKRNKHLSYDHVKNAFLLNNLTVHLNIIAAFDIEGHRLTKQNECL